MAELQLKPRLDTAASLLEGQPASQCIAEIGCDHGQLICALLERYPDARGIAADISLPSLNKAEALAGRRGLTDRMAFLQGDGFEAFAGRGPDAVFICGMGGELIRDILDRAEQPLGGARIAVLQPMSGTEELREYLYRNAYHVIADRIAREGKRYYQVLSVSKAEARDPLPEGFPEGLFSVGYRAYADRVPLYGEMLRFLCGRIEKNLTGASGSRGEQALRKQLALLRAAEIRE